MKATFFSGILCTLFGIFAGLEIGWRQAEAKLAKPITLTKACPQPEPAKPISRTECARQCYARQTSERIVQR